MRQVAFDHRHWPARVELVGEMRAWATRYGFAPLDVSFRRYEDDPLCHPNGGLPGADVADVAERRLGAIHRSLPDRHSRARERVLLRTLERWQSTLRQLDIEGRSPDRVLLAALCDRHAALWQLLKEWLAEETAGGQEACRAAFVAQIARHDETIAARAEALGANGGSRKRGGKFQREAASGPRAPAGRRD